MKNPKLALFEILCRNPLHPSNRPNNNNFAKNCLEPKPNVLVRQSLFDAAMALASPVSDRKLVTSYALDSAVNRLQIDRIQRSPLCMKRWGRLVEGNLIVAAHLIYHLTLIETSKRDGDGNVKVENGNESAAKDFMLNWIDQEWKIKQGVSEDRIGGVGARDQFLVFLMLLYVDGVWRGSGCKQAKSLRDEIIVYCEERSSAAGVVVNPFILSYHLDPLHPLKHLARQQMLKAANEDKDGKTQFVVGCGGRFQNLQKHRHNATCPFRFDMGSSSNIIDIHLHPLVDKIVDFLIATTSSSPAINYFSLNARALTLPTSLLAAPWLHTPQSSLFGLVASHPDVDFDTVWRVYQSIRSTVPLTPYSILRMLAKLKDRKYRHREEEGSNHQAEDRLHPPPLSSHYLDAIVANEGIPFQYLSSPTTRKLHLGKPFTGPFATISRQAAELYSWNPYISSTLFPVYKSPPPYDSIRLWPIFSNLISPSHKISQ